MRSHCLHPPAAVARSRRNFCTIIIRIHTADRAWCHRGSSLSPCRARAPHNTPTTAGRTTALACSSAEPPSHRLRRQYQSAQPSTPRLSTALTPFHLCSHCSLTAWSSTICIAMGFSCKDAADSATNSSFATLVSPTRFTNIFVSKQTSVQE